MLVENSIKKINLEKTHKEQLRRIRANAERRMSRQNSMERRKKVIKENFISGKKGEEKILEILKKKYVNIVDNNIENKYSKMDFSDNTLKIDFECKHRERYTHDQFNKGYDLGLMYGRNKFDYSVKRLKEGYRQIVFWICKDGIFYWEITDPIKQQHQYSFGQNSNKNSGQSLKDVVYVKLEYLTKL